MASYTELYDLNNNSGLQNKLVIAVVVAADAIRTESAATPLHAERLAWAKEAIRSPEEMAKRCLWAALAQNKALTTAQIVGASDAGLQTAVDAAVALLIA